MKKNSKYMYYSCLSSRLKVYIFILICACFMLFVLNKITGGILNIFTNFWQSPNDFLFFLTLLILFSAGFFGCGYSIFSCLMQMALYRRLEKNSKVNYTIIDIGGKTSISNYYSNIIGENADNDLKSIYLGIGEQRKDINYIAELRGTKTNIDIDVQGVLKDSAKKNFKGTIDFKKGSKKAKGNENEYCMLLSDKAKSIALPMLLCTEEDVEGNHSTASGKVDEKQLFYIMTRGISYKEAVKLIVKSKFNKIIERILDEELKNEILSEIDKRLD